MRPTRAFQRLKLELIDNGIAREQRHIAVMSRQREMAMAIGWLEGFMRISELIALSEQRLARLTKQRAVLVAGMDGEPQQDEADEAKE